MASNDETPGLRAFNSLIMKHTSIQTILVPVDFSKMSGGSIETAKRLGRRFGATIHLAHIHDLPYPTGFMTPAVPMVSWPIAYSEDIEQELARRLVALAKKHGLSSAGTCHIRSGTPAFDEICFLARELSADLIVTPTHGYTGLKHILLGSTAERVVQHSPCPVLVARPRTQRHPENSLTIDTILVPVDFSACSLDGLKYAIQFADRFAARIIVFHAVYLPYAYSGDGRTMLDPSVFLDAAAEGAKAQMREFVRAVKFGGVKFETKIAVGPSADEVCAAASNCKVDLVITSTHGHTGFTHVLIGSTAEYVVRHAPCPVLVVPSHSDVRAANLTRSKTRQTVRPIASQPAAKGREREQLTRRYRKLKVKAFPERRRTNKFRESHAPTI